MTPLSRLTLRLQSDARLVELAAGGREPAFDAIVDRYHSPLLRYCARLLPYDRAEDVVQRDVPVIPMSYGAGWALSRDGLLGAAENGLGGLRLAGLAWRSP